MVILILLFIVWGADVFLLRRHWQVFFGQGTRFPEKILFLVSCLMALGVDLLSLKVFSVAVFLLLSLYLILRLRKEPQAYGRAYYEETRGSLKDFLALMVVGLFLKWVWGMILISALISLLVGHVAFLQSEVSEMALLSFLAGLWIVALIVSFARRVPIWPLKELLGLDRIRGGMWWNAVVPVSIGIGMAVLTSFIFLQRPVQPVTPFSEMMDWADVSWGMALFLAVGILAAPFLEEVIFRGFFFRVVSIYKSIPWAFWVIALTFGFLHMEQYWGDWPGIAIVFALGLLLTWLRVKTNGIRAPVILHYVFNGLMVIIPAVFWVVTNPSFVEYYAKQAQLDFAQKEKLLTRSINEEPSQAMAYYELAWLYLDHDERPQEALRLIDRALEFSPERSLFLHTRAEALYQLGEKDQALNILRKLVERLPDNQELRTRLQEMEGE